MTSMQELWTRVLPYRRLHVMNALRVIRSGAQAELKSIKELIEKKPAILYQKADTIVELEERIKAYEVAANVLLELCEEIREGEVMRAGAEVIGEVVREEGKENT